MTLDQAVQKLIAYAEGNGGFDELDFKEYLFEVWLPEQMKITRNKEGWRVPQKPLNQKKAEELLEKLYYDQ